MLGFRGFTIPLFLVLFFSSFAHAYQQIEFIREMGSQDKKTRMFNSPRSVVLVNDRFYIADTDAHRVVVMDLGGKVLSTWGSKGDKKGQFRFPAGIAVDEQGNLYVADTGNHRIQVFTPDGKPLRMFGSKGSGHREFNSPTGIYVRNGLVYVADTGNSRVQVLSADGIFLKQVDARGSKEEMRSPVAVVVDPQNRIVVLDSDSNLVRTFEQNGNLLSRFGGKGRGLDGLDAPMGLALDRTGAIYVADTGNYKVKKFDPQGKVLASLGTEGSGPGQFRDATGLVVDHAGSIYILDAGKNTLQVLSCEVDGKDLAPSSPPASVEFSREIAGEVSAIAAEKRAWVLADDSVKALGVIAGRSIATRGSAPGMLKNPRGLALDEAGRFWVADTGNDRVQKFSLEGDLLQVIGKHGSGEGEFRSPSAVAIGPKGNLYVADTGNKRVQVFNAKGMFLGMFGKPGNHAGQFTEPVDIAADIDGQAYVADRGNDRIAKYDGNGTLLWETGRTGEQEGEFSEPSNILVSPDNIVYVLDSGNARVQLFDANGKFLRAFGSEGKSPGQFRSPQGLALEAGVRLLVGDRGNGRVQSFILKNTPSVPREVKAQANVNEIQLNWKGGTETYLEHYRIYRAEAPVGPFKLAGTTGDSFFVDKGLPSNKSFFYRVSGKAREGNESAPSDLVSAVTPRLVPAAPKKVKVEAIEKQMTVSWLPSLEPFVQQYRVYRSNNPSSKFELVGTADKTMYIDAGLADETCYYYQVTAVGKEGDESPAGEIAFGSTPKPAASLPPLEIVSLDIAPIFASAYKYYESHPVGRLVIRNNSDGVYRKVKVGFEIKEFMDYPTEIEAEVIPPGQQVEVELKPVFNNRILEVTENTPVQSQVLLTYYRGGNAKKVSRNFPVTLYERHAMVWDNKAKLGAFVTPKDPPIADFSRSLIRPYVEAHPNLNQPIVYVRALYEALAVLELKYIVDPTSPFQEFSEKAGSVDYLQYPRDTLLRKSGDCDDLSTLFAALLENIGIGSAFVDVPGHVFILFNTGVQEKDRATLGFPEQQTVVHRGSVWIPLEMTMVGSSFTKAWHKAAEEYRDWSAKGKVEIVVTQSAWEEFKPVTLPETVSRASRVSREDIESRFKNELDVLAKQRLMNLSAEYLERLKKSPGDADALAQLGILYGEDGLYAEALEQFQKILAKDKDNALALNNIGNLYLLQERLEDARVAYEAALAAAPDDTGTMTNLSRVLLRLGRKDEARKTFQKAASADPRVLRVCADLATSLGVEK